MKYTNPSVDVFLAKAKKWQEEMEQLRLIALGCGLTEELKWGKPCYTFGEKNVVLIHGFKEYCAFLFFKGALLQDPHGILVRQSAHVQAARQVRFTHVKEIRKLAGILKAYIQQAIAVEKSGLQVPFKKTEAFAVPEEFQQKLKAVPALQQAFNALTPGRQRGYLLHFSQPKQSKTREARVSKNMQRIMDGKGLNDE